MKDEIPLFPITALAVAPMKSHGFVLMRPDFLSHSMQSEGQATPGRTYSMTVATAQALIAELQRALRELETSGPQGSPGQTH